MTAQFINSPASHRFRVGGHGVELSFAPGQPNSMALLPNFAPFAVDAFAPGEAPLLVMTIDDTTHPVEKSQRQRIRAFETGNGDTIVDKLSNGGYQFIVKDIEGRECSLLIADKHFGHCRVALKGGAVRRQFGLNSALMMAYAFASAYHETLLIHASTMRHEGKGYPFIAKSGTGKSTHVSMWLRYIPGCDLMNDDNPVVRIEADGRPCIYGSPWSGKTPCYRNVKAPLGAITRIDRAKRNSIDRLAPDEAFVSVLPAVSSMKWDEDIYEHACATIARLIATTPIYTLHCLPDQEAATICHATLTNQTR